MTKSVNITNYWDSTPNWWKKYIRNLPEYANIELYNTNDWALYKE